MQEEVQPSQKEPSAEQAQMFDKRNSDITEVVGFMGNNNSNELNEN